MKADYIEIGNLVSQLRAHDPHGFTMLYEITHKEFYFFALSLLKNEQDAQDATQDTYVKILTSIHTLENNTLFIAWSKRILYHICLRMLDRKREVPVDEELLYSIIDISQRCNPLDILVENECKRTLIKQIQALSPVLSTTLFLKYYGHMKIHEIALIMDCPEGTVKSRISTAKKQLYHYIVIQKKNNFMLLLLFLFSLHPQG